MASSEIEIVSDSNEHKPSSNGNPNEVQIVDLYSASAYGDFEKLRKFVENDGASLSQPDGNGYYPLQWATLNNFANIVQYIIERGGEVNATDNTGQTALHWAAVRGSIAAADVLLQNGARVEAADINGYRPVHVAAQYGQTSFLNYIIAKYHADFDVPDNDGRTPLHWTCLRLNSLWRFQPCGGLLWKKCHGIFDFTVLLVQIHYLLLLCYSKENYLVLFRNIDFANSILLSYFPF